MVQVKRLHELKFKSNLIKRFEATNQITEHSLSKKTNKIYRHLDDDDDDNSYTKDKIKIESVNDDCLAEIFMYVPACERPKIALVCKKWKRALDYSWLNVKKLEFTYWRYDEYPNVLLKNYPTTDGQFNFLKSLFCHCGRYLRELDLTAYEHCNIVPIINEYCPNLEKLRIRIKVMNEALLENAFTRLSKLKILRIIFQCFLKPQTPVPMTLINSLLNVADTLTELDLSNFSGCMWDDALLLDETVGVFSQLTALKTYQMGVISFEENIWNFMKLRHRSRTVLDCYYDDIYNQNDIALKTNFESIKKLYANNLRVGDNFLYNISNLMKNLYKLVLYGNDITDDGIVAISKMKHLKVVLFSYGGDNVTDSSIELLKNMIALSVPYSKKITDKSVTKVLENSPQMKYFHVAFTGVTSEFTEKANVISMNRNQRMTLVRGHKIDALCYYGLLTIKFTKYIPLNIKSLSSSNN